MEEYFIQPDVAQQYDFSMFKTMPGYTELLEYVSDYVFNATKCHSQVNLLDIGCGTGNIAAAILKKTPCDQLSLLDHSRAMLLIAEKKLQKDCAYNSLSLFNNDFYSGLCELEQAGFYYDVITSGFCLDHIECDLEYIRVLNKIHDSLKNDSIYLHIEKTADKKNASPNLGPYTRDLFC